MRRTMMSKFPSIAYCAVSLLLCGCAELATVADGPALLAVSPPQEVRPQSLTLDAVTVSAALLPDDEARSVYGVPLAKYGLQALWISIENRSTEQKWLQPASIDRNYFSPDEAAFLFKSGRRAGDYERLRQHFRDLSMHVRVDPATAQDGYLLLPRIEGGRFVEIAIAGTGLLRFGLALRLPDGEFDYEKADPAAIYPAELPDLDSDGLRAALEVLPCCAADSAGRVAGDPLNFVLIGSAEEVMTTAAQADWSFTHRINLKSVTREIGAAIASTQYPTAPVSTLHLFGRPQDFALQRSRQTISQRNHARLWLAPFTFEGRSVWIGQISRDIGVKLARKSPTLTTHVIDPVVDEARDRLLQHLLLNLRIDRFGFVRAAPPSTPARPQHNLTEDPYFSDGLRLVLSISPTPTAVEDVRNFGWEQNTAPMAFSQSEHGRRPRPLDPR